MQAGLSQHGEKLPPGALVDRLRNELTVTVEEERMRNPPDMEEFVHFIAGIDEDGRVIAPLADLPADFLRIFIRDGEDDEALRFEVRVQPVEIGHLLTAGRAPGGPEVDQNHLAAQG